MSDIDNEARLSVLDLPQLHTKPTSAIILHTLSQLTINPSSFNGTSIDSPLKVDEAGVTAYLTRFIASPLAWITSDKEKEDIWEAASQRLSERSGRMAMASISRVFLICDYAVRKDGSAPRYISILVNEPSMTDDNVGHKTWTGSFLLAKRLPYTMAKLFPTLLPPSGTKMSPSTIAESLESLQPTEAPSDHLHDEAFQIPSPPPSPVTSSFVPYSHPAILPMPQTIEPVKVLELGAGTGLAGMAAAALFPNVAVHLTDLPSIVPNLIANVETNAHLFARHPTEGVLDWSKLPSHVTPHERYDCILAADSLYDPQHPDWLTNAMAMFLRKQRGSRIIVELPFRDMDLPYHRLLRNNMRKKGFVLLEEGRESGYDDWEGAWCEKLAVLCWWSVWSWAESELEQTAGVEGLGTGDQHERLKTPGESRYDAPQQSPEARETAISTVPSAVLVTNGERSPNGHISGDSDNIVGTTAGVRYTRISR